MKEPKRKGRNKKETKIRPKGGGAKKERSSRGFPQGDVILIPGT